MYWTSKYLLTGQDKWHSAADPCFSDRYSAYKWCQLSQSGGGFYNSRGGSRRWYFEHAQDAMLFILRWG